MENNSLLLVHTLNEGAELFAQHSLEGELLHGYDVNLETAGNEGSSDLEADEARPDNHCVPGVLRLVDDRAAVGERAEVQNAIAAWKVEAYWRGAGGDKKHSVGTAASIA